MENKRRLGAEYEAKAASYLEEQGFCIVERNFRCSFGEIDLIAEKDGMYLFVEVKYRSDDRYGAPEEAVSVQKQCRICRTAEYYCYHNMGRMDADCRFDVIAILGERLNWIPNAFSCN